MGEDEGMKGRAGEDIFEFLILSNLSLVIV
jgi:hypothetical protein